VIPKRVTLFGRKMVQNGAQEPPIRALFGTLKRQNQVIPKRVTLFGRKMVQNGAQEAPFRALFGDPEKAK
jgi:hypothetical protein